MEPTISQAVRKIRKELEKFHGIHMQTHTSDK